MLFVYDLKGLNLCQYPPFKLLFMFQRLLHSKQFCDHFHGIFPHVAYVKHPTQWGDKPIEQYLIISNTFNQPKLVWNPSLCNMTKIMKFSYVQIGEEKR